MFRKNLLLIVAVATSLVFGAPFATPSFADNFLNFVDDLPRLEHMNVFLDKGDGFNLTIGNDYFDIGRPLQCVPIKRA